jgi:signal transduction histidine kinase
MRSRPGRPSAFVDVFRTGHTENASCGVAGVGRGSGRLARAFSRAGRTRQQLATFAAARGTADWRTLPADAEFVRFAEAQLSGAIGSASARVMVASVAREEDLGLDEVLDILDEATQVRAYSRQLETSQQELEAATIAELREANERLRELDRMKDDFISTVTHELRTPLTSIRAFRKCCTRIRKWNSPIAHASWASSSARPSG